MMSDEQRKAVRDRMAAIEAANGGRLTPDAVVADAKDPASPLHEHFEWDIDKAAAAHWIEQARALITSVRVSMKTETRSVSVPYYVRDPSADNQQQGYISVTRLRTDADLARDAIVSEFSRVADLLRRARELAVALGAEHDVESLLQSVIGMRQRFLDSPNQRQ
jgi:hypothetical protein